MIAFEIRKAAGMDKNKLFGILNEWTILTNDEEEVIHMDNRTIKITPVWKWLLT